MDEVNKAVMISLIWAMDNQRLIGANNQLPWHLPADMAWFRQHTLGKPVLMGRKTYESIGKPLPKRQNIILSRQEGLRIKGCTVMSDFKRVAETFKDTELMVIGGAEIYTQALPFADKLYCTTIQHSFEGDAWFPELDLSAWQIEQQETHEPDDTNAYPYQFQIFVRGEQ